MECELVQLAGVPVGLVTSALFYTTESSGVVPQAELEGPPEQAREVRVAVCPTGRLIAFIASFKAQFVAGSESLRVGGAPSVAAFQTSYEGLLKVVRDPSQPRPVATAVVVVPVALETKKDPSSIVLVGFTDGYIRAYSKMGAALFSQLLLGEPVVTIHCMSPSGDHGGPAKNNMSVLVVFKSTVCILDGRSLCEAVSHAVATRDQWEEDKEAPVISYQKWRLGEQKNTADAAVLAPSVPTVYDYLCEAGNVGGYDTMVKGGPAPQSRLIAVGDSPMVALYKISKDSGTVNVTEVVSAVASKMTRSVLGKLSQAGGWLGWGGSTPPARPKPREKMVMNLSMSTNIPDERRTVGSISVSPLGNLSVCVDGFGRVLLLDNHAMTIRRMWKGYRDAQTGWILVHETPPPKPPATARGKRRAAAKSSRGGRGASGKEGQRRAQCLCIYLPRRGIVELWPVQSGGRVAVFQVGKGCRLLSAPHEVFIGHGEEGDKEERGWGSGCGLQHTSVLLCPNGQLLSFLVPFPTLARLNDSLSHDAHLLQKLAPALQAEDFGTLLQIVTTVKTAQSLREAVEGLMYAHPLPGLAREFPHTVLNISLMTRTHSTEPGHEALRGYLGTVRQLLSLHSGLDQLAPDRHKTPPPPPARLAQMLTELCGMAQGPASEAATSLQRYAACKPAKLHAHIVKTLSLKELMRCFELPRKMGQTELHVVEDEVDVDAVAKSQADLSVVPLVLRPGISSATLYDISFALFHGLLTQDIAEQTIKDIFVDCGIPSSTLLSLLCRVFLSGRIVEANPCLLLQRLHRMVQAITSIGGMEGERDPLADIRAQCSHTHNVGHALLFALLCQKLAAPEDKDSDDVMEVAGEGWGEEGDWGGGGEGWDTVTEEGEHWVRLLHRLEVLTSLCGCVGLSVMAKAPPLPHCRVPGVGLEVHLTFRETPGSVSMALLEAVGPWLLTHCVASWLVHQQVPPDFIASVPNDPADARDSPYHKVACQLSPLLRLFQHSLSHCSLLVHCAWHAAHLWRKEPSKKQTLHQYVLQCVSLIPDPQTLAGTVVFLWHSLFEAELVDIMDGLKRGTQQAPSALELISLCRCLFVYLYRLREVGREGEEEEGGGLARDTLPIPAPTDRQFLMDIVPSLAPPPTTLVRTYLALLLHTEVALLLRTPLNVTWFYPTWVRMALKKGLLKVDSDGRQLDVAAQLQQKRTKFLCDSVTAFLDSPSPKLRPSLPSAAIRTLPSSPSAQTPSLEVTEFTSALFLLGELWGVELDTVHRHYVSTLFAVGLGGRGREAFQSVQDKSQAALDFLSLAGCLTDMLIQKIASKPERLALTAQIPPTQLEWIRKQSSSGVTKSCPKLAPTWASLSQLVSLIQPHLTASQSSTSSASQSSTYSAAASIAQGLAKTISLRTQ